MYECMLMGGTVLFKNDQEEGRSSVWYKHPMDHGGVMRDTLIPSRHCPVDSRYALIMTKRGPAYNKKTTNLPTQTDRVPSPQLVQALALCKLGALGFMS